MEEGRILKARYNKRYREISLDDRIPSYLKSENLEDTSMEYEVKVLINLKCGNLEMANKY